MHITMNVSTHVLVYIRFIVCLVLKNILCAIPQSSIQIFGPKTLVALRTQMCILKQSTCYFTTLVLINHQNHQVHHIGAWMCSPMNHMVAHIEGLMKSVRAIKA